MSIRRIMRLLREKLKIQSPSVVAAKCAANFAAEIQRGLEEGEKNPLYRMTENGRMIRVRDYTPEELQGLAMAREIVARAFPDYDGGEVQE